MSATFLTLCSVCHTAERPNSPLLFSESQGSLLAHAKCVERSAISKINLADEQASMNSPPKQRRPSVSSLSDNSEDSQAAIQIQSNTAKQKQTVNRSLVFNDSADAKPQYKTLICYHCQNRIKRADLSLEYSVATPYRMGQPFASVMLHARCFKSQVTQDRKGIGQQASSVNLTPANVASRLRATRQDSVAEPSQSGFDFYAAIGDLPTITLDGIPTKTASEGAS